MLNEKKKKILAFFEKLDRTMLGDAKVEVSESKLGFSGADLNSKKIVIDFKHANSGDEETNFAVLKGLNFHESAHLKHTIKDLRVVNREIYRTISNCLEDGRIETIESIEYPKTKDYFETTFLNIIWKNREQAIPEMFLATQSRRLIIDNKIVKTFEKIFEDKYGKEVTEKVKKLSDEYLTKDDKEGQYNIVTEVASLMQEKENNLGTAMKGKGIPQEQSATDKKTKDGDGDPETKQEITNQLNENNNELDEATEKQIDEAIKNSSQERAKNTKLAEQKLRELRKLTEESTELETQKEEARKEVAEAVKEKNEEKEKLARQKFSKTLDKVDENHTARFNKSSEIDAIEAMKKKQVYKLPEVISEAIETKMEELVDENIEEISRDLARVFNGDLKDAEHEILPVKLDGHVINMAKNLKHVFRTLKNDNRRGMVNGFKTGSINITTAMTTSRTGNLRVFKRNIPDYTKKQKLGIILIVDTSGSMMHYDPTGLSALESVLRGSWAVKEALQNTDSKVAVIGYDSTARLMKPFNEKGNYTVARAGNHTYAGGAVTMAQDLIKKEKTLKNWLVVIMTDGSIADALNTKTRLIELGKNKNTETIFLGFGDCKSMEYGCKQKHRVNTTQELSSVFAKVVREARIRINNNIKRETIGYVE